jgi:hypothetical protein
VILESFVAAEGLLPLAGPKRGSFVGGLSENVGRRDRLPTCPIGQASRCTRFY